MFSPSKLIRSIWRNVTVEFYLFFFFLGIAFQSAAAFPLFYSKICLTMYSDAICANLSINPEMENHVQSIASEWTTFIELAKFLPSLVGTMFLGSFGDHYSTKLPALISLAFVIAYMGVYVVLVSVAACPLYSFIIAAFLLGFGGPPSFATCVFSFVAKRVNDESRLTFRYAVLIAFWSGSYVVAGNAAPFLYSAISYQYVVLLGEGILAVTFVLVLFFYPRESIDQNLDLQPKLTAHQPQIQNDIGQDAIASSESALISDSHASSKSKKGLIRELLRESSALYLSAWRSITRQRPNSGRLALIIFCLIGIAYDSEDDGLDTVTALYVFKRPLSWTPSLLAVWSAMMSLLEMGGSLVGAYLFQRFKIDNFWILLCGLCSACVKMLVIAISARTWTMFLALALGALSTVGFSALRALVVELGAEKESGELLGCLTATSSIVPAFSVLVYNGVYNFTLDAFEGATFVVSAGLLAVCALALICMRIFIRRNATVN